MNLKYINFAAQEKPIQFSSAKLSSLTVDTPHLCLYICLLTASISGNFSVECLFKMKPLQVMTFQHSDRRLLKQSLAVV